LTGGFPPCHLRIVSKKNVLHGAKDWRLTSGILDTVVELTPHLELQGENEDMVKQVSTLLMIASMFVSSVPSAMAFQNPDHKGTATVTLKSIEALKKTGSRDPARDKDCKAKFGTLIGKKVVSSYNINTKTLIMTATSTFEGQKYELHPLGIAGRYAFGLYFNPPNPPLNLYGVLFQVSLQFNNPASNLVAVLDDQTNCLVSSGANGVGRWGKSVPMSAPEK
jgi:hypothetical protein